MRTVGRDQLALVSSFGTESAALLKVMADVDPSIPVIFLDTGWLFEETLAYRDTLIAALGLRDVRSIKPLEATLSREDKDGDLWFSDPDACCRIRKVEPLARALKPFAAWINGRKRFQGALRAAIPVVEADGERLKFNPFANVSRQDIAAIYASANLPPHPLVASGFLSVGCMPCTSRTGRGRGCARRPLARQTQVGMRHPCRQGDVTGRGGSALPLPPLRGRAGVGCLRKTCWSRG